MPEPADSPTWTWPMAAADVVAPPTELRSGTMMPSSQTSMVLDAPDRPTWSSTECHPAPTGVVETVFVAVASLWKPR